MSLDTQWMGRTRLLVGDAGIEKLHNANVLIVGLGGVGSYAAEAICRAGVGNITIVDGDTVDTTNRNRQLPALKSTEGLSKVVLMHERLLDINPQCNITMLNQFMKIEDMKALVLDGKFDYVVDAIDSITPKLTLISTCVFNNIRIISSMGAGGKFDPTQILVQDISSSYNCNLAHYVRKRLRKYGIRSGVKVVFSTELAEVSSLMITDGSNFKRSAFGTISYMPAVFGLTCASVVVRELLDKKVKFNKVDRPEQFLAKK
ncbi:MAG: tRNA threonylcarbamoyladenosine dehydratase [Bacteroidia bacterium]|nr:tRNA threonylcarbamoyladenosine dehydratase [Bacteroidia bacterium]